MRSSRGEARPGWDASRGAADHVMALCHKPWHEPLPSTPVAPVNRNSAARVIGCVAVRSVIAVSLSLLVISCGSGPKKDSRRSPVTATVDLTKATGGAPDAGTSAGHGNDVANATTAVDLFSFTGTVDPPRSEVTVSDGVVRVEPSGRFTVATAAPSSGTKRLRLQARDAGREPWSLEVRLSRAGLQRVQVPEHDEEAPSAALALEHDDGDIVVQPSPSRAGERAEVVRLGLPRFRAIATVRDAEGGTGRVRVSVTQTERCDGSARETVRSYPSAQIVNIALPPGAKAPAERQRAQLIELDPREGCMLQGELLAEGTDAHGRQAVTAHIGFAYR